MGYILSLLDATFWFLLYLPFTILGVALDHIPALILILVIAALGGAMLESDGYGQAGGWDPGPPSPWVHPENRPGMRP